MSRAPNLTFTEKVVAASGGLFFLTFGYSGAAIHVIPAPWVTWIGWGLSGVAGVGAVALFVLAFRTRKGRHA